MGFEVCGAAFDGREAIERARSDQPDAVILDQEMPVMNGLTALPLIRQAAPSTTLVMFSSSRDRDIVEAALAHGAAAAGAPTGSGSRLYPQALARIWGKRVVAGLQCAPCRFLLRHPPAPCLVGTPRHGLSTSPD